MEFNGVHVTWHAVFPMGQLLCYVNHTTGITGEIQRTGRKPCYVRSQEQRLKFFQGFRTDVPEIDQAENSILIDSVV